MWCLSCFKPPRTADILEDEIARYRLLEDELLAKGIQESLNQQDSSPPRGQEEKEEETRSIRELESPLGYDEDAQYADAVKQTLEDEQVKNDEKIAKDLQNMVESPPPRIDERKRIYRSVPLDVVDEQLNKESLKEQVTRKQLEEQVKKDEKIAQDLQKHFRKMEIEERTRLHDNSVLDDEDVQLAKAVEKSLEETSKRKQVEEQAKEDEKIAKDLQNQFHKMETEERTRLNGESVLGDEYEDELLAKAVKKSLMEKGKGKQTKDEVEEDEKLSEMTPHSICRGCNSEIEHAKSVDISGVLWHPKCLWCDACHNSIAIHQVESHVSNARGMYHNSCYERYCYVCKEKKMRKYHEHHFWKERYCPIHDSDGTPKCCSCERLEPRGTNYVMLEDRRWLCLECMESAVMDSHECQPLHFEIREYFEGLNMKIKEEFPFLLVEKDALNKAEKEEKLDYHYESVTRGICLSEAQTIKSVSKGPRMGPNKKLIGMDTELQRVVRDCEVTAILILYGLPRLLTGYILAHEMMHAYLRLNGHRKLNNVHEEGLCQVLGHMWLESQRYAPIDPAASSSQTPLPVVTTASSKKGDQSEFEKKLVEFCLNQIETDESRVYGDGFRKVNKMVTNSNLQETLKEIIRRG